MKIVRESIFQGIDKEDVLEKLKILIKNETGGKIDINTSSFHEFFEEFFLKISSVEEWSIYPQTIENVNKGNYLYGRVTESILRMIYLTIPSIEKTTRAETYKLQEINVYEKVEDSESKKNLKNIKIGSIMYDDEKGAGDLYFILDSKGKIYKAIFLWI